MLVYLTSRKQITKIGAFSPLSAKFIKWSNTLKQIVGKLPTICLSVFDHFSGLAFKGLIALGQKIGLILGPLLLTYLSVKFSFY